MKFEALENFRAILVSLVSTSQSCVVLFSLRNFLLRITGCSIDSGATIHRGIRFLSIGRFAIGKNSTIGWGSLIDNRVGVEIGDNVSIGHRCSIYSLGHDPHSPSFAAKGGVVKIGHYVCILANVTIMPGVTIGEGAFIYSNSVVTRNIAPRDIVAGVPAKVVGRRTVDFNYTPRYRIWFGR